MSDSMSEKKVRVTITVPEKLINRIDSLANETYSTRSHWIVQAMLEKIKREEEQ